VLRLMQDVNTNLVAGQLGNVILVALFVVLFTNLMKNNSNGEAFTVAAFICSICATLFLLMGIITTYTLYITAILTVLGFVGMYISSRES